MKLSTKRENIIDDYHGVQVADPYRWLEDPDSLETKKWTDEQNERTNQYLENYHGREIIKDNITKMMNYPKYSLPTKEGKYYYFHKNNGLQNQAVFYRSKSLENKELETVIDPNTFSENGTAAITNITLDRKSTRLNSSHVAISYAVFCLKKKRK